MPDKLHCLALPPPAFFRALYGPRDAKNPVRVYVRLCKLTQSTSAQNTQIFATRKKSKPSFAVTEPWRSWPAETGAAWAFALGRPRQRSAIFWGAPRGGGLCRRGTRRTVPQEHPKRDFLPFRAGSAAPAGMPAVLGRGQDSPTRGTQPHFPAVIFLVQQQACRCYYRRLRPRNNS